MNKTNNSSFFDYIIIGGGSAGCALANRLVNQNKDKVLLIEAGQKNHPLSRIPLSFGLFIDKKSVNWRFRSEPEPNTNNRNIPVPRGKILGGSSTINGMVYVRGQKLDFDTWAQMGNLGWSYDDILPLYKKMENYKGPKSDLRGNDGLLNITEVNDKNPLYDAIFKSGLENDLPKNPDYNGSKQDGLSVTQTTIYKGRRMSAEFAYLKPIYKHKNFTVKTNALVTKLIIKKMKCVGVEVKINNKMYSFFSNHETILSAGSINSPQIMELSGIGQKHILEKKSIDVIHELKGVGENLRDHITPRLIFKIKKPNITFNDKARGLGLIKETLSYLFNRSGFFSLPSAPIIGFHKTRNELSNPDVQLHFVPYRIIFKNGKRILSKEPGITCAVNQNRPESKGSVHISSNDPLIPPKIKFNFLSSNIDIKALIAGIKKIRQLMASGPLKEFGCEEIQPGAEIKSDGEILTYIRERAETAYHPVGTCKMGSDDFSVVDNELKVRGIENLRIADASIMPTLVSGNTNAVCMMIGEKCADLILKHRYQN